nr:MAG TPA: hypothetical protein [Caudoviricetes sp.]
MSLIATFDYSLHHLPPFMKVGFPTLNMLSINQIRILRKTWGLNIKAVKKIQI